MVWIEAVIVALTLSVVCGQRDPGISHISQDTFARLGGTVELTCTVEFAEGKSVVWVKTPNSKDESAFFISVGSSVITGDNRHTIRHDKGSPTYALQITDIKETDVGIYECRIQLGSESNSKSAHVMLSVQLSPVISDNSTTSEIASEGERVQLGCYATGFPKPNITWSRNNNAMLPTGRAIFRGNVLEIFKVKKEDRGTYFCVADNGVGYGNRRNVFLEVQFAPVVKIARPVVYQALQYDADLECDVEAYPQPSISWFKKNEEIKNDQHYAVSLSVISDQMVSSTLRIKTAERRQFDEYSCQAINNIGTTSEKVQLKQVENPVCPPACHAYGRLRPLGASHALSSDCILLAMALSLSALLSLRS